MAYVKVNGIKVKEDWWTDDPIRETLPGDDDGQDHPMAHDWDGIEHPDYGNGTAKYCAFIDEMNYASKQSHAKLLRMYEKAIIKLQYNQEEFDEMHEDCCRWREKELESRKKEIAAIKREYNHIKRHWIMGGKKKATKAERIDNIRRIIKRPNLDVNPKIKLKPMEDSSELVIRVALSNGDVAYCTIDEFGNLIQLPSKKIPRKKED